MRAPGRRSSRRDASLPRCGRAGTTRPRSTRSCRSSGELAADAPRSRRRDDVVDRGPGTPRQEGSRRVPRTRRRPARRSRDDHLHLGDDRRAEGRDAHAREPGRQRQGDGAVLDSTPDDVALSFLPLSHVFERIGSTSICPRRERSSTPRRSTRRGDLRRAADGLTGVPRLFEKMHARVLARARRPARSRISTGRARRQARGRAYCERRRPCSTSTAASLADRLVSQDPRRHGRAAPLACRAARRSAELGEFFFGHRPADHRGLRPDRDLAGAASIRRRATLRHGRARRCRRRGAHRRRRRNPGARPERDAGYYKQPEATATRSATAGSTPATSAGSTPTVTSRSPIARRSCS